MIVVWMRLDPDIDQSTIDHLSGGFASASVVRTSRGSAIRRSGQHMTPHGEARESMLGERLTLMRLSEGVRARMVDAVGAWGAILAFDAMARPHRQDEGAQPKVQYCRWKKGQGRSYAADQSIDMETGTTGYSKGRVRDVVCLCWTGLDLIPCTEMSRPTSQHRLSQGAAHPASLPRNSYSRTHAHTISLGSSASNAHRIGRRKSSTFNPAGANVAALGAAVELGVADGSVALNRRRTSVSRTALASLNDDPSMPSSLPPHAPMSQETASSGVLLDGPSLSSLHALEKSKQLKARRASDGTHLTKKEKAAAGELKCEHCGKAYKHGSCLTKHLWEHTPQWQVTSKLLISKHQQVQLLEAASVLVAMNQDGPEMAEKHDSDSSSPAASRSSDMQDEDSSSAETTPPPPSDSYREVKRYSNTSSAYSRSYQSQSVFSESAPTADYQFGHHRHWSHSSNRPATAATSISIAESYKDEDPQDLAAADLAAWKIGWRTRPSPPLPSHPASWTAGVHGGRYAEAKGAKAQLYEYWSV
nr:hypothetical protein CFP56_04032 [Quercus suber]